MKKLNIPEDQLEIIRYRNMLFNLYEKFAEYRYYLKRKGIDDPEEWEMDKDLDIAIRLEQNFVDVNLSVRAINVLRSLGCHTLMDVVKLSEKELKNTPACGKKTLNEIKDYLAKYSLEMGMDVSKYIQVNNIAWLTSASLTID